MTEAQLNSKNKGQVVSIALDLQNQLESATAEPLTAAGLERKVLDLKRKVISVKDNALERKQEYETNLAKIKSDTDIRLRELELEHSSTDAIEAKELTDLFISLEDQSKKATEDLTFGLKENETTHNEKMKELEVLSTRKYDEHEEEIFSWRENSKVIKERLDAETKQIKTTHERNMEALEYDNSIAIRDKMLNAAKEIANEYESSIVTNDELTGLRSVKRLTEEELKVAIEAAEKASASKAYAKSASEFNPKLIVAGTTNQLLENDNKNLTQNNVDLKATVIELKEQLSKVPEQIKEAVAASQADIIQHNETKK